ncbi:conserved hypothetical protein [Vibrio chagasii]|nr:conserved hypothetical protein [Vibrio chagasii]
MSERIYVLIDMDDTSFDFSGAKDKSLLECPELPYPQSQYRFYADLEPIDGAIEAIRTLMGDARFKVDFCTAPSVKNLLSYTEKAECIQKAFGADALSSLFIVPDKSRVSCDYLIDDLDEGRGQELMKEKLIHFGSEKFPNWESVMIFLYSKAKELGDDIN